MWGNNTGYNRIDPGQMRRYNEMYDRAQGVADNLGVRQFANFTEAPDSTFFTADQNSAFDMARNWQDSEKNGGMGYLNQAGKAYGDMLASGPAQMDRSGIRDVSGPTNNNTIQSFGNAPQVAGSTAYGGINNYMNPYTDNAIQAYQNDMDRSRRSQITNDSAQAARLGAFGGSRHGVADALTNEAYARETGKQVAQMRDNAFWQAAGQAQQDAGRAQQANMANQSATMQNRGYNLQGDIARGNQQQAYDQMGQQANLANQQYDYNTLNANLNADLQGRNQYLQAAQGLNNTAGQYNNQYNQMMQALSGFGNQQQGFYQGQLDAERNLGQEQLAILQNALGLTPGNLGGSQQGPSQGLMGNLTAGANLFSTLRG